MQALDQVLHHAKKTRQYVAVCNYTEAEKSACKVIKSIFDNAPRLGIDIDGTIDESPEFFKMLSNTWPGYVYIITCRQDEQKARDYLQHFGIYYDQLVLVKRLEDKAAEINRLGVAVFVDDQDECLQNIDPKVTVLKIRNPGNFEDGKWLYSERTGECI